MTPEAFRRFLSPRLAVLSVLVALASAIPMAARWHWIADLFAHFVAHYAVAGACLFGLHLWLRQFRWAALALVITAANGALLAPYLLPRAGSEAVEAMPIRIFQFNLSRTNAAPLAVLGYLRGRNDPPEIAIFLEATPGWTADLRVMKDLYPTIARIPRSDNFGMAVLSRVADTGVEIREVGNPPVPLMVVSVRVEGKDLRIYATHPPPPLGGLLSGARDAQLEFIAKEIEASGHPHVVVAGDLNATRWSESMRFFFDNAGLHDAQRGFGYLPTWAPPPLSRWVGIPIDMTLVSGDVRVIAREAGPWLGSDHWPVQTTLILR